MNRRSLPMDYVLAAYNAVMAVVWTTTAHAATITPWIVAVHVLGAGLPWLLPRGGADGPDGRVTLRDGYPLIALALFWTELGLLQEIRQLPTHDALVAGWDLGLFGFHPHASWRPSMPDRWIGETMYGSYFAYYLLIGLPFIVAALRRRRGAFRDMAFRLMATYCICYLIYAAFPVYGPRVMDAFGAAANAPTAAPGFFESLVTRAREAGDSPGTAFPSSHAAGAVAIAWLGCRWFGRVTAALLVAQAAMVLLATIYTQNHFAVDAIAGLLLAVAVQTLLVPLIIRVLDGATKAPASARTALVPAYSRTPTEAHPIERR